MRELVKSLVTKSIYNSKLRFSMSVTRGFTITTTTKSYWEINLLKDVWDLYGENYKSNTKKTFPKTVKLMKQGGHPMEEALSPRSLGKQTKTLG